MSAEPIKVALLVEDDYEELELHYPRLRLLEAGVRVTVLGTDTREYYGAYGYPIKAHAAIATVGPADFHAALIPGGQGADALRQHPAMVDFVRTLYQQGKPVGWIAEGAALAIAADIVRDRRTTSSETLRDRMTQAGAKWLNEPVVRDSNLLSSRSPHDLPAFIRQFLVMLD